MSLPLLVTLLLLAWSALTFPVAIACGRAFAAGERDELEELYTASR